MLSHVHIFVPLELKIYSKNRVPKKSFVLKTHKEMQNWFNIQKSM